MFQLANLKRWSDFPALFYYDYGENVFRRFLYKEITEQSARFLNLLESSIGKWFITPSFASKTCNISIAILLQTHDVALLPIILGISNFGASSAFLELTIDWIILQDILCKLETTIVVCSAATHQQLIENHSIQINWSQEINLLGQSYVLSSLGCTFTSCPFAKEKQNLIFEAVTSGTSEDSRIIGVTQKCFWPNVVKMSEKYQVKPTDVIFVASPQTFDPFMIDVSLALKNGCSLIMTSNEIRLSPKLLLHTLFPDTPESAPANHVACTIMQMTPSLFRRWTEEEISNRVLGKSSNLRILALGGESFPLTETIATWTAQSSVKRNNKKLRIFNLYGLTEISCWSSIHEVTDEDIANDSPVPIGQPLDELTHYELLPTGELVIKSKIRKCFHDKIDPDIVMNDEIEFRLNTGDLFSRREDGELIFSGRQNSIVKCLGRKVDLDRLETIAKQTAGIRNARCALSDRQQSIIFFVDSSIDIGVMKSRLFESLSSQKIDIICDVIPVAEMPLSSHGKISIKKLLKHKTNYKHFLEIVDKILPTKHCNPNLSFIAQGGTSLKAMQIINEYERLIGESFPKLMPFLLNENISINEMMREIVRFNSHDSLPPTGTAATESMKIRWKFNMKKCIDATPTVMQTTHGVVVTIGSHSGLMFTISVESGELLSSVQLPDRIESQATACGIDEAIVGCYDGRLYCFDGLRGIVKWASDTKGMIKCSPLVWNDFILIGNYNEERNVWCINRLDGSIQWSAKIGTRSIFSNPIHLKNDDAIMCTLCGIMVRLNIRDGSIIWSLNLDKPIFSTPTKFPSEITSFVVATVDGRIVCYDENGESPWSDRIDANIFASFVISKSNEDTNFIFGSHDGLVHCISSDASNRNLTVRWKSKIGQQIRSTPTLFNQETILCCSTDGKITFLNPKDGQIKRQFSIDGEIFSSPTIHENSVLIGSRNDFIYCLEFPHAFRSQEMTNSDQTRQIVL